MLAGVRRLHVGQRATCFSSLHPFRRDNIWLDEGTAHTITKNRIMMQFVSSTWSGLSSEDYCCGKQGAGAESISVRTETLDGQLLQGRPPARHQQCSTQQGHSCSRRQHSHSTQRGDRSLARTSKPFMLHPTQLRFVLKLPHESQGDPLLLPTPLTFSASHLSRRPGHSRRPGRSAPDTSNTKRKAF